MSPPARPLAAFVLAACVPLAACSTRSDPGNDASVYEMRNEIAVLSPGTRPVRIGESGPAFPACAAVARVVNLSDAVPALPLRAAPFDEAREVSRLTAGTRVYLCAHSLDQRWQGVVVPPDAVPGTPPGTAAAIACGVTARLDAARDYAGPCRAGWVLAAYLRSEAN